MDARMSVGLTTVLYVAVGPLMVAAGVYWVRTSKDRVDASFGAVLVLISLLIIGTLVVDPVWWQGWVPGLPSPPQ